MLVDVSEINNYKDKMNKLILMNVDINQCFLSNEEIMSELSLSADEYFSIITSKEFQIKSMKVGAAIIRSKVVQVATATATFALLEKNSADRKLMFQAAGLLESNVNLTINKQLEEEDGIEAEVSEIRKYITDTLDKFSGDDKPTEEIIEITEVT